MKKRDGFHWFHWWESLRRIGRKRQADKICPYYQCMEIRRKRKKEKKKEKRKLITINNEMLHNAAWDAAQFKRLDRWPRPFVKICSKMEM
jgi:hypothetical protein